MTAIDVGRFTVEEDDGFWYVYEKGEPIRSLIDKQAALQWAAENQ